MNKEQLLAQCRYYQGEDEAPNHIHEAGVWHLWLCEQEWYLHECNIKPARLWMEDDRFKLDEVKASVLFVRLDLPHMLLRILYDKYLYYNGIHLQNDGVYDIHIEDFYQRIINVYYPLKK